MIQIKHVSKAYDNLEVLKDFSLDIQSGEIIGLTGPSGCGKTTLLNIIAGLEDFDKGSIIGVDKKDTSYIFQETRLLPWETLENNILFVLKSRYTFDESIVLTKQFLKFVNLYEYKDYLPSQLSGGMKQRASIARAFAYPSQVLLMDEPFKGLDYDLKYSLIHAFISLWEKNKKTVLFVTHDLDEAILMSNTIYVLDGRPMVVKNKTKISMSRQERIINNETFAKYKYILKRKIGLL